ncbi:1-phosphofructokinase family hexose kinase [Roseomonas sp. OT10]|uniref:1-phosphofructokinase family hexose kinase n=1 Tax=Roseomonas cutis TaxID=2897332 RepID=UPI001E647CB0|nr:1-phosphofructokinase family hexose kinase [Roseomonas sp. OT10]UFN47313.1 1-phosphofructokinase family hexose kinase [Roseomonas sp. OT10]
MTTTARIVTLTLNPSIDIACEAEKVMPIRKIRTTNERQDPGGGGINVARVVTAFGGDALALVLAGGVTGQFLSELLEEGGVPHRTIPIAGRTRISQTVLERSSGQEYRFTPEGPEVAEAEWRAALEALEEAEGEWLVASGSLPRGVPADFYAQAARIARRRGNRRFVLDTSGEALKQALCERPYLIKPSLGEFEALLGRKLPGRAEQEEAAIALVREGHAEMVALTLGRDGAILATEAGAVFLPALEVEIRGAVGAGDSFTAAMVMALSRGRPAEEAFAWGVAAGAAAVSSPGTAHPERKTVEALFHRLPVPAP